MFSKSFLLLLAAASVALGQQPVGDGKADDTAAIQHMFDTQGSVRLPKGMYLITKTLKIDLAKTGYSALSGDGTVRLVMAGSGPALHFIGTHEGSAAPESFKPEVWENQRTPMVEGIEIVGAHAEADGIEATGTMQITLSRVVIRECRHAVHLSTRNRNVLITACHFYHNTGIGVFYDNVNLHQSNIVGSHISYNGGGGVVSVGGNVRNLHIGTCDIEGNHAKDGPPSANVMLDSRGGSIGEVTITGCTLQHTHKSPDSANIRIIGSGTDASLLRRAGREHTREGNVTITANVFSDVQVNVEVQHSRGVTITGNTFWEGFQHDLVVTDCSNIVVTGNNFDRNPRYLVNGNDNAEMNGIVFLRCEDSILNNNVISGVWKQRAAVDIESCNRLQICHNSVLDSDGVALRLDQVTNSMVIGNIIRDDREEDKRSKATSLITVGGKDNEIEQNVLGNK
ncbi:MAG: right-handed parallel beta-helix repeat-containing protein [Prosthecobacter sp.]|uniref:right-handed parallel beta-helix repeat-containing protein n=1 Tax=Prosthecobacter sp. TaxID=1965333 RepID=UPI0025E81E4A|nr:right-handed parallel beta-helix repeat-containing protein [Prosthecobacter sp.]MCF7784863.1 right-handed parallel beta-helix repeat-containing protein [Prosthecobacter sp.]